MINLIPTEQKEAIRYAKLNRLVLSYLRVLVAVMVVLGVIFAGSIYMLGKQAAELAQDVATKTATIASINKTFTPKAKDASDRLAAIKYVQTSQTRFSALIADIAKVVPQGVTIDAMTLTGDEKTPLRIAVTATTYAGALSFRNAIITSPRVAGADLENISASGTSGYQTTVVVAFKPGQAK